MRLALSLIKPFELALDVRLEGAERIPDQRPLLFVGNHQLMALDTPFLIAAVYRERGLLLRGLADDLIYAVPGLHQLASHFGIVQASPEACTSLFEQGQCVLVYPGGAREASKGAGRAYELEWWGRLGFARLALEHRTTVVPVAAAGLDDRVRIFLDREDVLSSPLRRVVDALHVRHDLLPPVFVPKARPKLRFRICEPIAIDHFDGRDSETAVRTLRSEVARALDHELEAMLKEE